jgi:molybdopterin molybdotransferase
MLAGLIRSAGGEPRDLGIGRDDPDELRQLVAQGLNHDVLLLSGGVSAGLLDLVPSVLESQNVRQVFHKVRVKPGKPLWFGVWSSDSDPDREALVFGLPGNPVSTLVGFELFVRPALARLRGLAAPDRPHLFARLRRSQRHLGDRPTYYPGRYCDDEDQRLVEPLSWKGSSDLRSLVDANCLIVLEPGDYTLAAGQRVPIVPL